MKKNILLLLAAIFMVLSCTSSDEVSPQDTRRETVVEFQVNQEFDTYTRATLEEANISYLYVLVDGDLKISQTSGSTGFGSVSLSLTEGSHTITFVGSTTKEMTQVTSGTIGFKDKHCEVFAKSLVLDVEPGMEKQSVLLTRIVSKFTLKFTDTVPATAKTLKITVPKCIETISASGLVGEFKEYQAVLDITSLRGYSGSAISLVTLCPSLTEAWSQEVSVVITSDIGTTLADRTVSVPLQCNRETVVSGAWFSPAVSRSLQVETTWETPVSMDLD